MEFITFVIKCWSLHFTNDPIWVVKVLVCPILHGTCLWHPISDQVDRLLAHQSHSVEEKYFSALGKWMACCRQTHLSLFINNRWGWWDVIFFDNGGWTRNRDSEEDAENSNEYQFHVYASMTYYFLSCISKHLLHLSYLIKKDIELYK